MKSLLLKLVPGAVLTAAVLALGSAFALRAQNSQPVTSPAPAAAPASHQPAIVCGSCGAHIQAPQPLLVTMPANMAAQATLYRPAGSFYGIPPVGFVTHYPHAERYAYDDSAAYYRPRIRPAFPLSQWQINPHQIDPYPVAPRHHAHGRSCSPGCRY